MDQNIHIRQDTTETYEFQIAVSGLNASDMQARFVIHSDPFLMSFPCEHKTKETWTVELPKMAFIDPTTYTFTIEVMVDGYFFEAHRGSVTVVKSPEVYVKKSDSTVKIKNRSDNLPTPATTSQQTTKGKDEQPVIQPAADSVPEPKPVTTSKESGSDRFQEILNRIKQTTGTDEDEEKSTNSKTDNVTSKEETVVKKAEKEEDNKSDKKKEPTKTKAKTTKTKDSKKEPSIKTENKNDKKAIDHNRVKQLIAESRKERLERMEREQLRQQRITEKYQEKQQNTAIQPKEEPEIIEENDKTPNEKDAKAKAILESTKKTYEAAPEPSVRFKKGKTITR